MLISGFSYVRNGFKYGVPFMEAIRSILPICNEMVVVVGDSNDGTVEAIEKFNDSRIKIIHSHWDMSLQKGGKVFAQQVNLGLDAIQGEWGFHIQADEVIHEDSLPIILEAVKEAQGNALPEAFLFPFLHFWGDYQHFRNSRRVHNFEIRLFRNNSLIRAYRDSQGFRKYASREGYESGKDDGEKLKVKLLQAPVYHYNGVRDLDNMMFKKREMGQYYGEAFSDEELRKEAIKVLQQVDRVAEFKGSHPAVMQKRISEYNFQFKHDRAMAKWRLKDRIMQPIEDLLGFKIGEYKNYQLLK